MVELIVNLISGIATLVAHHPALLLPVVALFVIGGLSGHKMTPGALRARHGVFANPIIGAMAMLGGATWLYEHRRSAGRVMIGAAVAVAVLVFIVAVELSPEGWGPILVIGGLLAVIWSCSPVGPIGRRVGSRSLDQWWDDRTLNRRLNHAAAVVLDGTTVHGATTRADGTIVAKVQLPAGAKLDQLPDEAMASALAHEGMVIPVTSVDVARGAAGGQATLAVSPHPKRPVWDVIGEINNRLSVADWARTVSEDHDDPVPIGPCVDMHTGQASTVYMPVGFPHVLIAGATGAGKSGGFVPMIGGHARKRHVQFLLLDPQSVEFSPWGPRAVRVARGPAECYHGLQAVLREMAHREAVLVERKLRHWRVGVDGCRLIVVIDELADLTMTETVVNMPKGPDGKELTVAKFCGINTDAVAQIVRKARKLEIWLWAATQRADAGIFKNGGPRDNFGFRMVYAHESKRGSVMTLGEADDAPDATAIPDTVPGGLYVRVKRKVYVPARPTFIVPTEAVHDEHEAIAVASEEIAAMTAHLRDERLTYGEWTRVREPDDMKDEVA